MNFGLTVAAAFGFFLPSAYFISRAAWPRGHKRMVLGATLVLAAILVLFHLFLLLTTRSGPKVLLFALFSLLWFLATLLCLFLLQHKGIERLFPARVPWLGLKGLLGLLAFLLLLVALVLIPLLVDLSTNILWRYRAYMLALGGVAIIGAVTRNKAKTVLLGTLSILLASLAPQLFGDYAVAAPAFQAVSLIRGGLQLTSLLPSAEVLTSPWSYAPLWIVLDVVVLLISAALLGIASVILANTLISRVTERTVPALIVVLVLLLPGLLIPYIYCAGIGAAEFVAHLGLGAAKGSSLLETLGGGGLSSTAVEDAREGLYDAGTEFDDAERILLGLERMRIFEFLRYLPFVGRYSQDARHLAWGVSSGAKGLQLSGRGLLDALAGALTVFGLGDSGTIQSFDLLGPKLVQEELDEADVARGVLEIDAGFRGITEGFPLMRESLSNLSDLDIQGLSERLPLLSSDLVELRTGVMELGTGIDVAEIFLKGRGNGLVPATHLFLASYSMARLASNLTDLEEAESIPGLEDVDSNLSYVVDALKNPVVLKAREEEGDLGGALSFVFDAVDLLSRMVEAGGSASDVAYDLQDIRSKFEEKPVYNLTEVEFYDWKRAADSLTSDADRLRSSVQNIDLGIDEMISKAKAGDYGYANELSSETIGLLKQVAKLMDDLTDLAEASRGIASLVSSASHFHDFYYDLDRLQRQIDAGNLISAQQTAAVASKDLRDGKLSAERALAGIESMGPRLRIPITEEQVSRVLDSAASVELQMSNLEMQLESGDREEAIRTISAIKEDFTLLAERLRLES